MEEILQVPEYGPDGKEKKTRSSVETYFRRQDRERLGETRLGETDRTDPDDEDLLSKHKRSDLRDDLEPKEERAVPVEIKEDERGKMRGVFDPKPGGAALPFAPESGRGSLSDFFGLGNSTPSAAEQMDAHKGYMKKFGELLPSTQIEAPSSLSGLFNDSRMAAPVSTLQSFPSSSRPSVFDTSPGSLSSPLAPASVLPDANAGSVSSWSSPSLVPRMELPKVISPTSVGDFPRRKF
jgi:hypothetical protein